MTRQALGLLLKDAALAARDEALGEAQAEKEDAIKSLHAEKEEGERILEQVRKQLDDALKYGHRLTMAAFEKVDDATCRNLTGLPMDGLKSLKRLCVAAKLPDLLRPTVYPINKRGRRSKAAPAGAA